jgi:hypothetical protein
MIYWHATKDMYKENMMYQTLWKRSTVKNHVNRCFKTFFIITNHIGHGDHHLTYNGKEIIKQIKGSQ